MRGCPAIIANQKNTIMLTIGVGIGNIGIGAFHAGRDIGGDEQRIEAVETAWSGETFKHILLPVWMSAYRYRGKVYHILINARTGELIGARPYSAWKITLTVLAILLLIGIIVLIAATR